MSFTELIRRSEMHFENQPLQVESPFSFHLFENGAKWMSIKMNALNPQNAVAFDSSISFTFYGMFKYAISLLFFAFSFIGLTKVSVLLAPISVFVFYFFEVHFLFLFPLLIDKVEKPIWTGIKLTYQIGVFKTVFTVMQIAFYMVWGLLNFKDSFRTWHIGCLAILVWYQDEIRDRI